MSTDPRERTAVPALDRVIELKRSGGVTVPKRVVHRTRAPERAVILMMDNAGSIPTGN
jgi:hypothetical protein